MKIGSVLENQKIEKRISITPEIAKKYISSGFDVSLPKNYASHIGFDDENYKSHGVKILENEKEIIDNSDVIVQLGLPSDETLSLLRENQCLIGILNPYTNKEKLENLSKKNVNTFSLELLPRITRAQSMDILSSQANLAGYKAVIESFANFEKAIPMMMTAAGTIPAAKVLVVGAGVAGLQAIATAQEAVALALANLRQARAAAGGRTPRTGRAHRSRRPAGRHLLRRYASTSRSRSGVDPQAIGVVSR